MPVLIRHFSSLLLTLADGEGTGCKRSTSRRQPNIICYGFLWVRRVMEGLAGRPLTKHPIYRFIARRCLCLNELNDFPASFSNRI
jgi:hypothetical protein